METSEERGPSPEQLAQILRREVRELAICTFFLDQRSVAIDAGAFDGTYARALARKVRLVHCFEPHPASSDALRSAVPENCIVHERALSSRNGIGHLVVPQSPAASHLDLCSLEKSAAIDFSNMYGVADSVQVTEIEVELQTIDDFLAGGSVHFIKIDVEGHELDVLKGAQRTIEQQRPILYVEIEEKHKPGSRDRCFAHLGQHDYRGYFLNGGALRPIADFDCSIHQSSDHYGEYVRNFIFLP